MVNIMGQPVENDLLFNESRFIVGREGGIAPLSLSNLCHSRVTHDLLNQWPIVLISEEGLTDELHMILNMTNDLTW
jgi:hypothetical protein